MCVNLAVAGDLHHGSHAKVSASPTVEEALQALSQLLVASSREGVHYLV